MLDNIAKRKRRVDVKKLENSQLDEIGEALGTKVGIICDKAAKEVNDILEIYGLTSKVAIQLFDKKTGKRIKG